MLVSIDKIRRALNIDNTDTVKDSQLKFYESIAKNWIESYCEQPIESTNIDLIITSNTEIVYLNYFPINFLNSIKRRVSVFEDWQTLSISDYYLGKNDIYYLISKSDYGSYEYMINIAIGYNSIPETIQNIALEVINSLYNQYENQTVNISAKTQTFGTGQTTTETLIDLTPKHKALLSKYKRVSL